MKLRPVSYQWKDNDRKDLGFIAQEIRVVIPDIVMESKDSMNTLLMNYNGVIPVLVKAFQEQNTNVEQLSSELKDNTLSFGKEDDLLNEKIEKLVSENETLKTELQQINSISKNKFAF